MPPIGKPHFYRKTQPETRPSASIQAVFCVHIIIRHFTDVLQYSIHRALALSLSHTLSARWRLCELYRNRNPSITRTHEAELGLALNMAFIKEGLIFQKGLFDFHLVRRNWRNTPFSKLSPSLQFARLSSIICISSPAYHREARTEGGTRWSSPRRARYTVWKYKRFLSA